MKKYWIITYGCQMNLSDSERIRAFLGDFSYRRAIDKQSADLIIINACSVRQSAVDRIYGRVRFFPRLKEKNKKLKTILTGCVLDSDKKKLKDKFDYILDIRQLADWENYLFKKKKAKKFGDYLRIKPNYNSAFQAYVPIANGCNNFCAYCVVPYVRGREVYRPAADIMAEVKKLIESGYKKIILLGQNVNSYQGYLKQGKIKKEINFPQLLKLINDLPGDFWLEFITSHPKDMDDELIETTAKSRKVCPYIHLPIQAGDNQILKKMNRYYTVSHYENLIKKIRKAFKKYRPSFFEVAISTDVIVGFPGETKRQFENTVKIFKKIGFTMAYIAEYSPRGGTSAAKFKDDVPSAEKTRRKKKLCQILEKSALANNKKYKGKIVEVLVEKSEKEEANFILTGKTPTSKNVQFNYSKNLLGEFVSVKITKVGSWGMTGELVSDGKIKKYS